ncbi:MAG TPA: hypothetical protein VEY71_09170, partial [Chitinophagales bacterium]|nr:hypothetical protein [Chitinophagales bacterium]
MATRTRIRRRRLWFILLAAHVVLCLVAFNKAWTRPDNFLFHNEGDPMKNYFIMDSYLAHDSPKGALHYAYMNYPFGDYVYFTDNTPVFGWVIKLFSRYLFDITPYWLHLFHLLVPLNILLVAWMTWHLANRFLLQQWLRVLVMLAVPWINPQVARIQTTSNLSYAALIVAVVFLLVRIYDNRHNLRSLWKYWIAVFTLTAFGFYVHGYYVALIAAPLCAFHAFWLLLPDKTALRVKLIGLVAPLLAVGLDYLVVTLTDDQKQFRSPASTGYDWIEWKMQVMGLFTPYMWNGVRFFFESQRWINYESHTYLSAFVLFGVLLLGAWLWYKRAFRPVMKQALVHANGGKLLVLLFLAGAFSLVLSYGNKTVWLEEGLEFQNIASPFYWLYEHVPIIGQFRALGRFAWIFFIPTFFIVARLLEIMMRRWPQSRYLNAIAIVLLLMLVKDTYDMVRHLNNAVQKQNPLRAEAIQVVPTGTIDASQYQCILPLPVYTSGADVYGLILDPPNNWMTFTLQLSKKTDLPLMAFMLNRTPVYQAEALLRTIANYKMDSVIAPRLNPKPVLVVEYKPVINNPDSFVPTRDEPGRTVTKRSETFTGSLKLPLVFENDSLAYYRWDWHT